MAKIEIARLRKDHSMSQGELAQQLQITQSFLSAIENGKSPLPPEKEEKLLEIFGLKDLSAYTADNGSKTETAKKVSDMTDSDLFNQLLHRFHQQAHSKESHEHHHDHHERIENLEGNMASLLLRNDRLMERNESLSEANDRLRNEIDDLRNEIYRLKSLLVTNKIPF